MGSRKACVGRALRSLPAGRTEPGRDIVFALALLLGSGAGSEARFATGITVVAGMVGVTLFGLLLTPVFYGVLRRLAQRTQTGLM